MRKFSHTKHMIFFLGMICSFPARAQEPERITHIELLSAVTGAGRQEKISAALSIDLQDGWYTYWRMAGDNGLPPFFDWSQSENVRDVEISWPAPARFTLMDMHSFGYKDAALLPLDITPERTGEGIALRLTATLVVCKDICIPETITAALDIPAGESVSSPHAEKIANARAKLPARENTKNLGIDTAVLSQDALVVTAYAKGGFADGADLILETNPPLFFAAPEIIPDQTDKDRAILKLSAPDGMNLAEKLFGQKASLTLIHNDEALTRDFTF